MGSPICIQFDPGATHFQLLFQEQLVQLCYMSKGGNL